MSEPTQQQFSKALTPPSHDDQSASFGKTTAQQKPETPPQLADDYEFEEHIGEGTQGHVYRAKDLKHGGRSVAIKQLRIASVSNWKEYDLFQREAQVLSSLHIPGVASVYETREYLNGALPQAFIVQEYIEGKSLASMIHAGRRLHVNQIYSVLIQLLEILQKLHKHEPIVIHRDIKPSNIIMKPNGQVYLIDFGAVANPQVKGGGSTIAGTFGYMPPEQMMGCPVPESDVYSLAATAVHLFSGVSPEEMETADFHLLFEPYMQSMPSSLTYTLRAMLDPDVRQRFCDIPALIRILTSFKTGNYDIPEAIAKIQETSGTNTKESEQEYHEKLAAVSMIRAPGNAELWHRLPNQVPRTVPPCYSHINVSDKLSALLEKSLKRSKTIEVDIKSLFFGLLFGAVFIAIFCLFIDEKLGNKNNSAGAFLFGITLQCLFWYYLYNYSVFITVLIASVVVLISLVLTINKSNNYKQWRPKDTEKDAISQSELNHLMHNIVQNGIKTIATIVDVKYVSQPDGIYINEGTNRPVYTRVPLFKIQYRFNPENDSNPDDLEHTYYTHTPPEDHYDVGDPLPILFFVVRNNNEENVYSIPFPLPMQEHLKLYYLIGHSSYHLSKYNIGYQNDFNLMLTHTSA